MRRGKREHRAPAMSLTSLHLDGEVPPFFSFVVDKKLAACGNFDPDKIDKQLQNLRKRDIGGVVSLTEHCWDQGTFEKNEMRVLHLPTQDFTAPSIEDLKTGAEFIVSCNQDDRAVVVHCAQGIGRTGTMLGAYFILEEQKTAFEAIQIVRDRRAGSIHKKGQELRLYELEEAVRGTSSRPDGFTEAQSPGSPAEAAEEAEN
eukprot:Hpha_TRINITY_DN16830_c4_g3::TRINITY_DN16830_c4_g3_i1::g.153695::m.153695/K14165/K14165; atypical dual specificity phosphatase